MQSDGHLCLRRRSEVRNGAVKPRIQFEESHHPEMIFNGFFVLSSQETDSSLINYFPNWASHSFILAMV